MTPCGGFEEALPCACLRFRDFHKINNTEEECCVEALGAEMVGKLTYYERRMVTFFSGLE